MKINKIDNLDIDALYKVLTSSRITETQKTQFVIANRGEIKELMKSSINDVDF